MRELLDQMPGVVKSPTKSPKLQLFLLETENIRQLRNRAQHLNQEIKVIAEREQPVWGVVR